MMKPSAVGKTSTSRLLVIAAITCCCTDDVVHMGFLISCCLVVMVMVLLLLLHEDADNPASRGHWLARQSQDEDTRHTHSTPAYNVTLPS